MERSSVRSFLRELDPGVHHFTSKVTINKDDSINRYECMQSLICPNFHQKDNSTKYSSHLTIQSFCTLCSFWVTNLFSGGNDHFFWNPGAIIYALIPRCRPNAAIFLAYFGVWSRFHPYLTIFPHRLIWSHWILVTLRFFLLLGVTSDT